MRAVALVVVLGACVDTPGPETELVGPCNASITNVPIEDSPHVPVGSPIEWSTNPPATGPHYPVWLQWERRYDNVERAYWLHNTEHGGIALLYRCTDCPDVTAELAAVIGGVPDDPHCTAPIRTRTLVAHDPLLPEDVTVAAVAWGAIYTATCVDDGLSGFVAEHYGKAGENTCADGLPLGGLPLE